MMNLMKADVYRIFRGKGIYITICLLLVMYVLQAIGEFGSIGINVSSTEQGKQVTEVLQPTTAALLGSQAPIYLLKTADNYLYFLLALIVFIAAADFAAGTTKNVLSSGVSRLEYFASKLILAWGAGILLVIMGAIIPTVLISIQNGFGQSVDKGWLALTLQAYSMQLLYFMAIIGVGVFVAFWTKKTAAVITLYICFCMVPVTIIGLLAMTSDRFVKLFKYDFILNIRNLADIQFFTTSDYQRVMMIGLIYLVVSVVGGYQVFRKCDIK